MALKKISEFTLATILEGTEEVPFAKSGLNGKFRLSQLLSPIALRYQELQNEINLNKSDIQNNRIDIESLLAIDHKLFATKDEVKTMHDKDVRQLATKEELQHVIDSIYTEQDMQNLLNRYQKKLTAVSPLFIDPADNSISISLTRTTGLSDNKIMSQNAVTTALASKVSASDVQSMIEDHIDDISIQSLDGGLRYTFYCGDKLVGTINIPQSQLISNIEYDQPTHRLLFTFDLDGQQKTVPVDVTEFVKTYTAGDNITISDAGVISCDFDLSNYLTKAAAERTYLKEVPDTYSTKDEVQAQYLSKEAASNIYAKKEDVQDVDLSNYITKIDADDTYCKKTEIGVIDLSPYQEKEKLIDGNGVRIVDVEDPRSHVPFRRFDVNLTSDEMTFTPDADTKAVHVEVTEIDSSKITGLQDALDAVSVEPDLEYDSNTTKLKLTLTNNKGEEKTAELDATPFIKDGILSNVETGVLSFDATIPNPDYVDATTTPDVPPTIPNPDYNVPALIFTWNTDGGDIVLKLPLSSLNLAYTASRGVKLVGRNIQTDFHDNMGIASFGKH